MLLWQQYLNLMRQKILRVNLSPSTFRRKGLISNALQRKLWHFLLLMIPYTRHYNLNSNACFRMPNPPYIPLAIVHSLQDSNASLHRKLYPRSIHLVIASTIKAYPISVSTPIKNSFICAFVDEIQCPVSNSNQLSSSSDLRWQLRCLIYKNCSKF